MSGMQGCAVHILRAGEMSDFILGEVKSCHAPPQMFGPEKVLQSRSIWSSGGGMSCMRKIERASAQFSIMRNTLRDHLPVM